MSALTPRQSHQRVPMSSHSPQQVSEHKERRWCPVHSWQGGEICHVTCSMGLAQCSHFQHVAVKKQGRKYERNLFKLSEMFQILGFRIKQLLPRVLQPTLSFSKDVRWCQVNLRGVNLCFSAFHSLLSDQTDALYLIQHFCHLSTQLIIHFLCSL